MSELLPMQNHAPGFFCYGLENASWQEPTFVKESPTTISTNFTAPVDWIGLGDILHGGFQGLLLDEIMCRVAWGLMDVQSFMTKELTLRYRRPVYVGRPLGIWGYLVEDRGQEITTRGEIKDAEGNLLTEAHSILVRTEAASMETETSEGAMMGGAQPRPTSPMHWPAWQACCAGPLERLWDLHIDWRVAPDRSALAGFLRFPLALRQVPPAGILAALFDQTLGLLGRTQGHGVMLTVRLQVTAYRSLPVGEELILLGHGYRWLDGPFKAEARLQHQNSLVAQASGHFRVLASEREG